jgi:hypothetical protein
MEDDADRVAHAGANAADAVTKIDAIRAARPLDWPFPDRKDHGISLTQRHHLDAALHAWPLLRHAEFSTSEVLLGLGEQNRDLYWEYVITVEVLMKAIEVT